MALRSYLARDAHPLGNDRRCLDDIPVRRDKVITTHLASPIPHPLRPKKKGARNRRDARGNGPGA